jgi:predicted nucleic acid-binding protein
MNKTAVFIDTSAWFAIASINDHLHKPAVEHAKTLVKKSELLITSNFVIHETTMLLSRRISKDAAIKFLDAVYQDPRLEILPVNAGTEEKALELFKRMEDQDFSVVDCTSFVLMQENQIKRAFTFDSHFKTMKFEVEP